MAHGIEPSSTNVPQPYGTPDASLLVFAGDRARRVAAPLHRVVNGTPVVAAGMVHEAREHGTIDQPRATLQLLNEFGQAAYAAADSDTLALYSLFLMDGCEVSLHGIARQPFPEDPRTTYIQITSVEPLFG